MSADLESTADEEWTAEQCAEYVGVKPVTWRSYSHRPTRDNPAPKPKRYVGRTPLWSAREVKEWDARRPGSPVVNAPTAGS